MIRTEKKGGFRWAAPCLSDPAAIRAQLEEYRLTGRVIDLLHLGGFSHFHTREWIEEEAFARLEGLDEEERLCRSRYGSIPGDMRFDCCVLLDSTFSVEFMDGKALVIASPGEPVFRMSSNPYDRWAADGEEPNVSASDLFGCCCEKTVTAVKVDTRMADCAPLTGEPYDTPHEVAERISLCLEGGLRLEFRPWGHFLMVRCVDAAGACQTISCEELRRAMWYDDNTHRDERIGFEAQSRSVFCSGLGEMERFMDTCITLRPDYAAAEETEAEQYDNTEESPLKKREPARFWHRCLHIPIDAFDVLIDSIERMSERAFDRTGVQWLRYSTWMAALADAEERLRNENSPHTMENAEMWYEKRALLTDIRRWSNIALQPDEVLAIMGCPDNPYR